MKKTILRITGAGHVPSALDGIEIRFLYAIVTITKEAKKRPVEGEKIYTIKVIISGSLAADWGFGSAEYEDLVPLLMPYAIEHVKERYYAKSLLDMEEVRLIHGPAEPEYDMDEFPKVAGYEELLEESTPTENMWEAKASFPFLADGIITLRDQINAKVYSKTQRRLLELDQEQNLKELYSTPTTKEAFWYGLAALANLAGRINKDCVMDLMEHPRKEAGAIKQLELYLKTLTPNVDEIIVPLKSINHIRQGYPIHTDKVDNYIATLNSFGLGYPITDYPMAWGIILNEYAVALRKLFETLQSHIR